MNNSIQSSSSSLVAQYWTEQIKLKRASGLSRATYCKKHNMSYHRFAYWEQKLSQTIMATKLLPVNLSAPQSPVVQPRQTLCTLMLKSGAELKVHDAAILPILFSVLN